MSSPSRLSTRRLVSPAIRVVHPVSRAQPARISSRPPFVHPSRSTAPLRDAFDAAHLCEIRVPPPNAQHQPSNPKRWGTRHAQLARARHVRPLEPRFSQVRREKKGSTTRVQQAHGPGPAQPETPGTHPRRRRRAKKKNAKPLSGPPYQRTRRFHHRGPSILAAHARSAAQVHFGLSLGDREGGCWRCG